MIWYYFTWIVVKDSNTS